MPWSMCFCTEHFSFRKNVEITIHGQNCKENGILHCLQILLPVWTLSLDIPLSLSSPYPGPVLPNTPPACPEPYVIKVLIKSNVLT